MIHASLFLVTLAVANTGDRPAERCWGCVILGAAAGATAGAVLSAGTVFAIGYACQDAGITCFGSPDAPLLGAFLFAPFAAILVGGVGTVIGAGAAAALTDPGEPSETEPIKPTGPQEGEKPTGS